MIPSDPSTVIRMMRALVSQLSFTIARRTILVQLCQLVWMSLEDLFLLVWVATLIRALGVLATSTVSFGDVLLPKLVYAIVLPRWCLLLLSALMLT